MTHLPARRPTWVVVPALDEAMHIASCLEALAVAASRSGGPVRVVVVDDGSIDATSALAAGIFARRSGVARSLSGIVLLGRGAGVGWARRVGLEHALMEARHWSHGGTPPPGAAALIATTDADSRVDSGWLRVLHERLDEGHVVVAGDVHLHPDADPRVARARAARLAVRLRGLPPAERPASHPHFAGSNLAFAAEALEALGPLPAPRSLEDAAILECCRAAGLPVLRDHQAIVVTSARVIGRAPGGLADALQLDAAGH